MDIRTAITLIEDAQTSAFDRWFAGSKIVDDDGSPLKLYHGTSKDQDFRSFRMPKNGIWFTTDPQSASDYAKDNDSQGHKYDHGTGRYVPVHQSARVIPVYVRAVNPMYLNEIPREWQVQNYRRPQGVTFDLARARGHDAVIMHDGAVVVVIGSPNQIKSAIGNKGSFDPAKKNIDEAEAPEVPQNVVDHALRMLDNVSPDAIGDTALVDGYNIETHTLGCRNAADDPEEEWWDRHFDIFDEYENDGRSTVLGDPSDGKFVTITPSRKVNEAEAADVFDWTPSEGSPREQKLGASRLVYYVHDDKNAEISSLRTASTAGKQNKGSARAAMEQFCREADAHGITIKLQASPLTKKVHLGRLVAFYQSLGFELTGRTINLMGDPEMVRKPQTTAIAEEEEEMEELSLQKIADYLQAVNEDILPDKFMDTNCLEATDKQCLALIKQVYLHGACAEYAYALHRKYDWPIIRIMDDEGSVHYFCKNQNGNPVDFSGETSLDAIKKRYKMGEIVFNAEVSPDECVFDEDEKEWGAYRLASFVMSKVGH